MLLPAVTVKNQIIKEGEHLKFKMKMKTTTMESLHFNRSITKVEGVLLLFKNYLKQSEIIRVSLTTLSLFQN